jgi:hypothetical protein
LALAKFVGALFQVFSCGRSTIDQSRLDDNLWGGGFWRDLALFGQADPRLSPASWNYYVKIHIVAAVFPLGTQVASSEGRNESLSSSRKPTWSGPLVGFLRSTMLLSTCVALRIKMNTCFILMNLLIGCGGFV